MSDGLAMPDFDVRDVIDDSITAMLADPGVLDALVGARPQAQRDSWLTALKNREGRIRLGWGQENPEDWQIAVLLAGTQKIATIGDRASNSQDETLAARELATDITAAEPLAVTFTTGVPAVGDNVGEVPATGLVLLGGAGGEYATYVIASGVCTLTHRGILGSTAAAHAATTAVVFHERSQQVGWPEQVTVRADLLGSNPEFVMALGRMLQGFLVASRDRFEARGYTLQDVVLGDLAPRPVFYPALLFLRTLTLRFLTALSLPEIVPVITETQLTLATDTPAQVVLHNGL